MSWDGWIGWCHQCGTLQLFAGSQCAEESCDEPWGLGVWPVIAPEFVTPAVAAVAAQLLEGWSDDEFGTDVHLAWFATQFEQECQEIEVEAEADGLA